jgi:hypothetical protein
MEKPTGAFLLVCVCILLAFIASAVESGRIVGANYTRGLPLPGLNLTLPSKVVEYSSTTTVVGSASAVGPYPNGTSLPPGQRALPSFSEPAWLALPGWFLTIVLCCAFVGACFLVLRLKTSVNVVDLEDTLKEMELQQKYLEETWSSKMRNAALLRYYLLLKRACTRVGLPEDATETPQEYIGRASSFLKVEPREANRFADLVDRSRYGEELSKEEAIEASKFMSAFTELVRRKTNEL